MRLCPRALSSKTPPSENTCGRWYMKRSVPRAQITARARCRPLYLATAHVHACRCSEPISPALRTSVVWARALESRRFSSPRVPSA